MKIYLIILFSFATVTNSCNNQTKAVLPSMEIDSAVLADFKDFWQYWYDSVQLYKNYEAYDTIGKVLEDTTFISLLRTGNFMPIKVNTSLYTPAYKLIRIPNGSSTYEIKKTIINEMQRFFENSQLQGRTLGEKRWLSPDGYELKAENFKGNYVLIKCWFLKCAKCLEEMPRYDSLFMQYGHKNLIFLALAEDNIDSIQKFRAKTGYQFHVIPNQSVYVRNDLHVTTFPTYILVGEDGKILKVVNTIQAVEYLIHRIAPKLHEVAPPPALQ